jgi:hypothetical protein
MSSQPSTGYQLVEEPHAVELSTPRSTPPPLLQLNIPNSNLNTGNGQWQREGYAPVQVGTAGGANKDGGMTFFGIELKWISCVLLGFFARPLDTPLTFSARSKKNLALADW